MKVYLSHSRQNASVAFALRERLKSQGVDVFLDLVDVRPGGDFREQIKSAIEQAEGLIVLVGPEPSPDGGQRFEWQQIAEHEYYLDPAKPIIPVRLGSSELPGFLRTRVAISLDPRQLDIDELSSKIASALGKPEETVDREKLERGRAARQTALEKLKEYSHELERADVKEAAIRGLK